MVSPSPQDLSLPVHVWKEKQADRSIDFEKSSTDGEQPGYDGSGHPASNLKADCESGGCHASIHGLTVALSSL